jgi:DNA-binding SARP family transcriptional activator/tetratricopeptide (TPR) repeat protein
MWLGVLGPLDVRHGNAGIAVPAAKQRVVLSTLLVHANQAVSFDQLAEAVWGDVPPDGSRVTLRNYVKRLRQILGPTVGERIQTRDPGYQIDVDDSELDLLCFTKLFEAGGAAVRSGAWEQAEAALGEALDLWRGAPLADIPSDALRRDQVPRLEQLRLQVLEWQCEAQLHLGRHEDLVPQLGVLVAQQPLRERFHAQLMLAYYRCGRQADALGAYQDARRVLIDQLGVEPGPELRGMQQRILASDPMLAGPTAMPSPRQLPPAARYFAGRASELGELAGLLEATAAAGRGVVISVIGGAAGVGKSALALHWAHQVAECFPDGQLYVNLRGFDPSGAPVTPEDAVRGFLDAFRLPAAAIPASPDAQVGLYRSLLAKRRMLIVLDNARHTEQVRPLLPGGPGCLVVVTSRSRLTGLVAAEGAHPITLDLLTDAEARDLLGRRLGADRLAAEPAAVASLVRLCARLPLALSIAAARAATNSGLPLAVLAAELAEAGLDALATDEDATDIRAMFSWSCQNLSPTAAHTFRLLGVHPGPDISAAAAASMAGLPRPVARKALVELTAAQLIQESAGGRFAFHDLLRAYAAELADARGDTAERQAAERRMLDHYTRTARAADRLLDPLRDPITASPPEPGVTAGNLSGYAEALAWFQAEHRVLRAAVTLAAHAGLDAYVGQLAWALTTYFNRCGYWQDWAYVQRTALASAERIKDTAAQARAHNELGRARLRLGGRQDALAHQRRALILFAALRDPAGQARSHIDLGRTFSAQGRHDLALDHASRSLSLAEAGGSPVLRAGALNNIGWYHAHLGDHAQALSYCQRALGVFRELGHRDGEAQTLDSIGYAYHHLGQHQQAVACYQHALGIFRARGTRYDQAYLLSHLGEAHRASGDSRSAREAWRQALAILDDLHHPDADQLRVNLRDLDAARSGRAT